MLKDYSPERQLMEKSTQVAHYWCTKRWILHAQTQHTHVIPYGPQTKRVEIQHPNVWNPSACPFAESRDVYSLGR